MKNFSIILSTVAVILAAVSLTFSLKNKGENVDIEGALKANPQMVVNALQAYQEIQQAEKEKAAQKAFEKYASEINSSENAPFVGPKDAKVTVVEFFDFSCGYCQHLAPTLEKLMKDNADVKFVFKPLSFVSPISHFEAQAGLAVFKQGKFAEYYKAMMEQKPREKSAVEEIVKNLGVDFEKFSADVESSEINDNLSEIGDLAQKANINGVPLVIVNGKPVQARDIKSFQDAINAAK